MAAVRDLLLATERVKQPLDAAVRRFADASKDDARLLSALLDVSPQAEPLVRCWPDEVRKGTRWEDRESVALYLELVTTLLHTQAHERHAQDAADALALKIVRDKSASLEKMLSWSDKPIVEYRVLELMATIVGVSATCARELVRIFDFQSASFTKIAARRMKKAPAAVANETENPEQDDLALSTSATANGSSAVPTPPTFQIRAAYIRLVVALAVCPDKSVHRFALKDGGVMASLFKALDGDYAPMLATVMGHFETLVLRNDNVDMRGRMAILNNAAVQQLVTVVKSEDEDVATQAWAMLSKLLLEDGALYHIPARQSLRLFVLKSATSSALSTDALEVAANDGTVETTNMAVKVIRGVVGSVGLNDYVRSSQVRGLISKLLMAYPGLVSEFIGTLGSQLEPKTGYRWFCVASMVQNVLATPLDAMLADIQASSSLAGDSAASYTAQVLTSRIIMPISCRKELSRGLQHTNILIIYSSLGLIECALRRYQFVQSNLPSGISSAELENELRFVLPSSETLVSLLMKLCAAVDKAALVYLRALTVFRLYLECLPLSMSELKADFTKLLAWHYLDATDGNTSRAMRGVIVGEVLRVLMVVDETRLRYVVTSGTISNGEVSKLSQLLRLYTDHSIQLGEARRSLARAVLLRVFVALKVFGSGTDVSPPSEEISVWLDNMVTGGDATTVFVETVLQDLLSDPFSFLVNATDESASPSPATLALIAAVKNRWPIPKSAPKLESVLKYAVVAAFAARVLMSLLSRSPEPTLVARLLCADDSGVVNGDDEKPSSKKRRRSDSIDLSSITPLQCVIATAQLISTPATKRSPKKPSSSVASEWKPAKSKSAFADALFGLHASAFVRNFPGIVDDLLRLQLQPRWLHDYIGARPDVDLLALTETVNIAAKKDKQGGPFLHDLLENLPLQLISQRILFVLAVEYRGGQDTQSISRLIKQLKTRVNPDRLTETPGQVIALVAEQVLLCIEIVRHVDSSSHLSLLSDALLRLQVHLGTTESGRRLHEKVKKASTSKLSALDLIALARCASIGAVAETELLRLRHPGGAVAVAMLTRCLPVTLRLQILKRLISSLSRPSSRAPLVLYIIKTLDGMSSKAGFKHSGQLSRRLWNTLVELQASRDDSPTIRVLSAGLHVIGRLGGIVETAFRDSGSASWAQYLHASISKHRDNQTVTFDELVTLVRRLGAVVAHRDTVAAPSPVFEELIQELLKSANLDDDGRLTAVAVALIATFGGSCALAAQENVRDRNLVTLSIEAAFRSTSILPKDASLGLILLRQAALSGAHDSASHLSAIKTVLASITKGVCPSPSQLLALLLSLRGLEAASDAWPAELAVFLVRSAVTYALESDADDDLSQRTLQSLHLMLHDLLEQVPTVNQVNDVVLKVTSDVKRLVAAEIPSDASAFHRFVRASRVATHLFEQQQRLGKLTLKGYSVLDHLNMLTSHKVFPASLRDPAVNVELLRLVASMLRLGGADLYSRTLFQHLLGAYDVSLSLPDRMIRSLLDEFEVKAGVVASQYGYRFGSSSIVVQTQKHDGSVRSDLIEDSGWLFSGGLEPTRVRATIEWFPLYRGISVKNDATLLNDGYSADFEAECADVEESSRPVVYDPSYLLPMLSRYVSSSALPEAAVIQQGVVGLALRAVSSNADDVREFAYAILAHVHESLSADATTDFKPGRQVHLMLDTLRNALQEPLEGVSSAITVFMNDAISILCRPGHTMYPHVNHFLLARPALDLSDVPMFYSLFNSHSPQTYKQERSWLLHGLRRGVREDADVSLLIRRHVPSILLSFFGSDLADDHTQLLVASILASMLKTEAGAQYLITKCAFVEWLTNHFRYASNATTSLPILSALGTLLEECLETNLWNELDFSQRQVLGSAAVSCFEAFVAATANQRAIATTKTLAPRIGLLLLQRAAVSCSLSTYASVFSLEIDVANDSVAIDCMDAVLTERLMTHPEFQKSRFVDWSKLLSRATRILARELGSVLAGRTSASEVTATMSREVRAIEVLQRLRGVLAQAPTLKLLVLEDLADDLTTMSLVLSQDPFPLVAVPSKTFVLDSLMPLDATARHVFAYGGTALQMADEHTLVAVAGNALQFSSTVTPSQHFLLRPKARKLLVFDVNWRNAEIIVTSRDPNPEVLVYTYPDKKLRGKLQNGAAMEYAHVKYSRCGRRVLTVRADDQATATVKRLCVWDMEKLEPLKGCANTTTTLDVAFASFDPSNADHFLLGGLDGLQLSKIYKGKASYMLRHVTIKLSQWTTLAPSTRAGTATEAIATTIPAAVDAQDLDERRQQLVCHAWMRQGRVLVANRAGELVMVDTAATVEGSELAGVLMPGAIRPSRCCAVGVVYTTETIVVVYADGYVAWLEEATGEWLQGASLPGFNAVRDAPAVPDASLNVIASVAAAPTFAKVYVGTLDGHIYELKVSVALDDDDELEDEQLTSLGPSRVNEDPSLVASRLISSCGSFHASAVFAATTLTPSGGTFVNDLVIASGGSNGRLYLWSATKCRSMGETNVAALFAASASALLTADSSSPTHDASASSSGSTNTADGSLVPPATPATVSAAAGGAAAWGADSSLANVVITALAARPADPVLLIGDQRGKLRALCVAKVVGGNGALECLPLHSFQLLSPECSLDILELHPTQPFVLAASTHDRLLFVLSLDHEKHFAVLAYVSLPTSDERIVDVKWSVPPHSPAALSFTFYTTAGKLYLARYQDTASSTVSGASSSGSSVPLPVQLKPKPIAHSDVTLAPKCAATQFLTDAPVNVLLAVAPQSTELLLLKYADLVIDPNEKVPLQSKVLASDAHDPPGIAAIAVYSQRLRHGEQLVATAGINGAVTIWMLSFSGSSALQTSELHLEDVQAAKKKTLLPHLGVITSLQFVSVGAEGEIFLVTTGADGCVYLTHVQLSSDMVGLRSPEPIMSSLYLNVANFAKYEDPFKPELDAPTRPFLSVVHDDLETIARNRFDRLKDKTRAQLNDLEMKLKILLSENEKLPEAEQLARDEFVINTEWRDKHMRQNHDRALSVRESIQRDLAKMNIVRERMKHEFWDSASTPGVTLRGITPAAASSDPLVVYNFPMRKPTKQETLRVRRIELLRLIEYEHQKAETLALTAGRNGSAGTRSRTPEPAAMPEASPLARFHDVVSRNLQWLVGAGALHPSLNRWINDKTRQAAPPPTKDAPKAPNDASPGSIVPAGTSPLVSPVAFATLNDAKSFHLVYHPMAVRTRKQQRTQIQLLKDFVRFQVAEFNREFQELVKLKETKMDEIEAKNARIQEIAKELGNPQAASDLFRPKWSPDEIAASILEVAPEEMTQKPYESEDARRAREKEAAEKAELERQRQKDDVAGRALKDMMDGTLEVKKDALVNQTLVKEAWMIETPVDDMTAEQKKLLAQFEAAQQKLKEEQEKYRKSLDLELKKIKTEIVDICKGFDDKVRALQDVALALKTSMLGEQLYELRLAEDLMAHEHLGDEVRRLEAAVATKQQEMRVCEKENEVFAAQVEARREDWHRAVEEDKVHEKGFLRDLEDAVTPHGIVLEHDLIKHLVELYKKRKGDDVRVGGAGVCSSTNVLAGGPKRGKSSANVQGSSKQRLLAEASSSSEASSRTLAATTLLQNLQAAASSNNANDHNDSNFDPFASIELPPTSSTPGTRHVVPLDYEVDRPDGLMIDDRVWRTLNELRSRKILTEYAVREKAEQFNLAKAVADELHAKLEEVQAAHESDRAALETTRQQLTALADNASLLVHIKQGQDETGCHGTGDEMFDRANAPPSPDALLITRASVEALNDVIQLHGKDQVGVLGKIKNFRKNINVMEWEHALLDMQTRDMEERYTDIQLLRVTKELQELFHTGDTSQKQKRELALLEAKLEHLGKHHQSHVLKLDAEQSKFDKQLRERMRENDAFAAQVAQLEMQVQIREDILLSRKSAALRNAASTDDTSESDARLKAITVRRKLVDLARAQTEEIEFLRMELDKMRRRTFPTFAQQHASQNSGVDRDY